MEFSLRATAVTLVAAVGLFLVRGFPNLQTLGSDCTKATDCNLGECCVVGMMRYSTPQCMPMAQMENFCREDEEPENRTLFYPDGKVVDLVDVYTHLCPCDFGLLCVDNSCSQNDSYDTNYIF